LLKILLKFLIENLNVIFASKNQRSRNRG
jgi:hypothetical protein